MSTEGVNVVNPVAALVAIPVSVPIKHGEKSERFNGNEFKRWQQNMQFYLSIKKRKKKKREKRRLQNTNTKLI